MLSATFHSNIYFSSKIYLAILRFLVNKEGLRTEQNLMFDPFSD